MTNEACKHWHLDLVGFGTITAPNGEQVTIDARLDWIVMDDHTVRFLIYAGGDPVPLVRVFDPPERTIIPRSAVQGFAQLVEPESSVAS